MITIKITFICVRSEFEFKKTFNGLLLKRSISSEKQRKRKEKRETANNNKTQTSKQYN